MQENVFRFALQMKAGRTLLGWSQTELAKRAGIARPTVARIESFIMQPKLETAERIKDHQPEGGFTMVVRGAAIQTQLTQVNEREADATKKLVEQVYGLVNKG
jgi:predicted transcriptional regulator